MSTLWQKTRRDLWRGRWTVLGLAGVVAIVCLVIGGATRAHDMLSHTRETWLERLQAPDLEILCSPTLPGAIDDVRLLPGLAEAEERMLLEGEMQSEGNPTTSAFIRVLPAARPPRLYALHLLRGRLPRKGEVAAVIDRSLRRTHDLNVGDTLSLRVLGEEQVLPIVGISLSAEHLLLPIHPEFAVTVEGSAACVAISEAAAQAFPLADRIDSCLFRFDLGADPHALRAALLEKLPVAPLRVIDAENDPTRRLTGMLLSVFEIAVPALATVVVLVALALYLLTLAHVVRRQRRELGALIALGWHPARLSLGIVSFAAVPAALGALAGLALNGQVGAWVFNAHVLAVGYAPLVDPGPSAAALMPGAICLAVAIVAGLLTATLALRQRPGALLSPLLWRRSERMPGILGRALNRLFRATGVPLSVGLGVAGVLRRRWATWLCVIALASNFAVVMAFLFTQASHEAEVFKSFGRIGLTATAYFSEPLPTEALEANHAGHWDAAEPLIARPARIQKGDHAFIWRVLCLPMDGWISRYPIALGRGFSASDALEVQVDRWVADHHDLHLGDKLTCYPFFSAPEGLEVELVGIYDGLSMGLVVLPLETGRSLYSLPGMCTGLSVASTQPREDVLASLRSLPHVQSIVHMDDARRYVSGSFNAGRVITTLMLIAAVLLALIFLAILASLDAYDRAADVAILNALGWRVRSILALCLTEVMLRGYLAVALAIPLGPLFAHWVLYRLREANNYRLPLHDPLWVYLMAAGLALFLIPLGAWPAARAVLGSASRPGRQTDPR